MTMQVLGSRPRVLQPGLMLLAPGTERYIVHGGAATAVSVRAGDVVEIVDPSGRQVAEVAAFAALGGEVILELLELLREEVAEAVL